MAARPAVKPRRIGPRRRAYFSPMFSALKIYDLIENKRRELGLSQTDVGMRAFGKADNTAIQSIKKGSAPSVERMKAICDALNLEFYIGVHRDVSDPPPISLDGTDFSTVPRVAAEASAGPGALNGDVEVVGSMAFRTDWLRDHGVRPGKALLVSVTGDGMAPRIEKGDLVLLDLARTDIVNGQPCIFKDTDGETHLKRLHRLGKSTLALVAENPPTPPPELRTGPDAERIKLLGQIIWSGHSWG